MRINALAILFAITFLYASPSGAQKVSLENQPLPQFMPPAARAQIATANPETDPSTGETRRAAEELSARFSGDLLKSDAGAPAAVAKTEEAALPAKDPQATTNENESAHVAVLRARDSPRPPAKKKLKRQQTRREPPRKISVADASEPPKYLGAKSRVHHGRSSQGGAQNSNGDAGTASPKQVPGAEVGWKTGILGMLTNPAFWH